MASQSVLANSNTIPATITVEDETLAAAISPTSLSFDPNIGEFSTEEIQIENTGQVAFYPSVAFTNFSSEEKVEPRGVSISSANNLLFKAGNKPLDLEAPEVYPKGRDAVTVGSVYRLPLSVGAGANIPKGSNVNLTFDIEVTLDRVMEVIENLKATVNGSEVQITWDTFNLEGITADKYRISAFKLNPVTQEYERYSYWRTSTTNSYTWTGLEMGADYRFEVVPAITNYRYKALSAVEVNVPTIAVGEEEVIAPTSGVQNIQYTVDGTTVNVAWDKYMDSTRYKVYFAKKVKGSATYEAPIGYSSTSTSYSRSLNAGYDYKVTVVPYLDGKYDSTKESSPIEFTIE